MSYAELLKQAEEAKTVQSLTVNFHAWDKKGETVLGRLISITHVPSSNGVGTYNHYMFDTDGGYIKCALGTVADTDMAALWQIGGVYHIKYEGKEKLKGGKSLHRFTIDLVEPGPNVEPSVIRVDGATGEELADDDVPF